MKTSYTVPQVIGIVRLLALWLLLSSGIEALAQPSGCTGQNPGGSLNTSGLYAEYYSSYFDDDQAFFTSRTPGLTRIDAQVNFPDSGFGNLASVATYTLADPDAFSLRQRGSLLITTPGTYTFYLTSDDASLFWLDNAALARPAVAAQATIAHGGAHMDYMRQASLYLTAGPHNVLLHYGEDGGNNILILEYEGPDAPTRRVIPTAAFCTAIQPLRSLPTALRYVPGNQTVPAGTGAVSPVPTCSTAGVPRFELTNAEQLPAGITINAGTGQLTLDAGVSPGLYQPSVTVTDSDGAVLFRQAYTFVVGAAPLPSCTSTRPDGGMATSGLYTEYYGGYFRDNPAFFNKNQLGLVRLENQLNFTANSSWGYLTPAAIGSATSPYQYSARVRGSFAITTAGAYTFYLTSDDASWLWLDNAALASTPSNSSATINNGGLHQDSTVAVTVQLSAGQHDLQVQYGNDSGDGVLILEYEGPDAPTRRVMPPSIFCSCGSGRPLSVRTAARQITLQVAPNPNKGNFVVRIGQQQPGPGTLQLLDMRGRLCYQTSLLVAAEQQVQVPGLAAGVYVVRLTTEKVIATHKVVVE